MWLFVPYVSYIANEYEPLWGYIELDYPTNGDSFGYTSHNTVTLLSWPEWIVCEKHEQFSHLDHDRLTDD